MAAATHHVPYTTKTNSSLAQGMTIFVGLVIDKVLDIQALRDAAQDIVSQWPILGGQLITTTKPMSLKAGNTVDFKSRKITKSLQEYFPLDFHIVDLELPTYLGNPSDNLFHFDSFRPLNIPADTLFAIRVTVLEDATLLGFRVPHHFSDGQSAYDIVSAYSQVISGETLPRLTLPPDAEQPISTLIKPNTDAKLPGGLEVENVPYLNPNENLKVGFTPWIRYVGYAVLKMLGGKFGLLGKSEEKFIHLPKNLVETWRSECQAELDKAASSGEKAPILSRLDVITAWFLQMSFKHTPSDDGPVDLMYNFSYRFALPAPEPSTTYLKNSFYELRVHWDSLSHFQTSTLASVAASIRTTVLRAKQPSVIKTNLEFQELHATELVAPGAENMRFDRLPFVSSWLREDYCGLDFSGAVAGGGKVIDEKARVVFAQPRVALPLRIMVDPLAIVMKDGQGGYWLRANLSKSGWKAHGI